MGKRKSATKIVNSNKPQIKTGKPMIPPHAPFMKFLKTVKQNSGKRKSATKIDNSLVRMTRSQKKQDKCAENVSLEALKPADDKEIGDGSEEQIYFKEVDHPRCPLKLFILDFKKTMEEPNPTIYEVYDRGIEAWNSLSEAEKAVYIAKGEEELKKHDDRYPVFSRYPVDQNDPGEYAKDCDPNGPFMF